MMDSRGTDRIEEQAATGETPEDVAVLYSWANLHGAKYRDFSASRREYRAQLRHRAAQQVREQALLAQAEAEAAAAAAESAERRAVEAARQRQDHESDSDVQRALREAEEAARTAAAERVEAARRAEAAAVAEAAARREEREIAEAHASAQRQAARYADSEIRRRAVEGRQAAAAPAVPGAVSDPYVQAKPQSVETITAKERDPAEELLQSSERVTREYADYASVPVLPEQRVAVQQVTPRPPQGYQPDDASGVRRIYRGPEPNDFQAEPVSTEPARQYIPRPNPSQPAPVPSQEMKTTPTEHSTQTQRPSTAADGAPPAPVQGQRRTDPQPPPPARLPQTEPAAPSPARGRTEPWSMTAGERPQSPFEPAGNPIREVLTDTLLANASTPRQPGLRPSAATPDGPIRAVSPFSQALVPSDSTRGRRAQDDFDYQHSQGFPERERRALVDPASDPAIPGQRPAYAVDPSGPAWLYAPPAPVAQRPLSPPPQQSSVADTLQHSRERVAARWYALKGVFEQPGQEQPEPAPVRQKETRTPVFAVFSLAGGVGKTSLVATVGRSLSSMGEKVLLTDTTSHGLLPFYFGASELRQGTVRTFSPPSGSTDAPIYLVSYDVEQRGIDEAAEEKLAEEIINNSRGTHRILLDFSASSIWILRRMARMNPTVLIPVAPDMNSVISLQSVERLFHGVNDGDGRPLQPFYVLNQFDPSLPLHLDVREVLRRQLGDRLLPFVIRRAPAVSEALAEGMTVIDYAPDSPVAEDYQNVANWLRTVAAPATAGFRNVRWSER